MKRILIAIGVCLLLAGLGWVAAASPAGFTLDWWSVDGGGGRSEGGGFVLNGTAGQPDAGLLTGDDYALGGGFWQGGPLVSPPHRVYLPLVLRQAP